MVSLPSGPFCLLLLPHRCVRIFRLISERSLTSPLFSLTRPELRRSLQHGHGAVDRRQGRHAGGLEEDQAQVRQAVISKREIPRFRFLACNLPAYCRHLERVNSLLPFEIENLSQAFCLLPFSFLFFPFFSGFFPLCLARPPKMVSWPKCGRHKRNKCNLGPWTAQIGIRKHSIQLPKNLCVEQRPKYELIVKRLQRVRRTDWRRLS